VAAEFNPLNASAGFQSLLGHWTSSRAGAADLKEISRSLLQVTALAMALSTSTDQADGLGWAQPRVRRMPPGQNLIRGYAAKFAEWQWRDQR
jgi:hypothetical protein